MYTLEFFDEFKKYIKLKKIDKYLKLYLKLINNYFFNLFTPNNFIKQLSNLTITFIWLPKPLHVMRKNKK